MLRQIAKQLQLCKIIDTKLVSQRCFSKTHELMKEQPAEATAEQKPNVLMEKEKNITLIGINRPQQRNSINSKTAAELSEAFNIFEEDETSPVAVLYGVGGTFCSGFDIFELGTDGNKISIDILMTPEGSVGPTRRQLKKPVICGINGHCIANGLELALMCDLRVMEETAILGFFNRRFGVPVIDGGTVRLPAMIGLSRALDLILTGRQVSAQEAHEMGIANRVVPPGTSLHHAVELATALAKFPQGALNHDRNSLYSAVFSASTFNQSIQNEIMYTSRTIIEEMQDGIKWFNKTFSNDTRYSWLKYQKSMADWDDEKVAAAAAKIEVQKQAEHAALIASVKLKKAEPSKKVKEPEEKKSAEKRASEESKQVKGSIKVTSKDTEDSDVPKKEDANDRAPKKE